ncbi:hypothetical protein CLV35_0719 [Motilibacter peucedani]|uniref:DUF2029 domain-containing protein n=1 Tax=Motilibacter peucedani TaxID=598650 RepID=A0A420XTX4_9ACTN|nr:hypothetical protein [Motilibacter peucedani]RKS80293.1 hypothetical protein CLV35_0719 [Motilibacter peucedani]
MPSSRGGTQGRLGLAGVALSVALLVVVGALGDSAATPPLGPRGVLPPWSARAGASSATVTALLWLALAVGTAGSVAAVVAVRAGWRPRVRALLAGSCAAVGLLALVPPMGSADHLSYAAYGRITVQGGDAYAVAPDAWRSDRDPVVSAVRPPWRSTPSVYGPVATAAMAGAAVVGGDSVRHVVWALSLLFGAAFALVGAALARAFPDDPLPLLLWGLNPLLLWALVAGAHVDALAALPAVAAVLLLRRPGRWGPLLAGALAGAALSVKLPFGVVLLAVLWAVRRERPAVVRALVGAAGVVATAYALAGPHALSRTGPAAKMVSLASPWGPVAHALDGPLGFGTSRWLVRVGAVLLALALVAALHRLLPEAARSDRSADAARAWLLLGTAYVLAAPYALPWYDAIAWAPLALIAPSAARSARAAALLVAHAAVLAAAYVPGRVEGLSAGVEHLTLVLRRDVAPWWAWAVVAAVLVAGLSPGRQRRRAAAPARSPR